MKRIVVDWDLCEANGICEAMAPESFEIDDDDMMQVLDDVVTPGNEAQVLRAVNGCPKSALSIVEQE
jgi:ferredoxin